ncbi:MAG: hypothetical protein JWR69_3303 [Pedosphaera sp.]|nr:hypothetical protein [Pedosphaera sp.]
MVALHGTKADAMLVCAMKLNLFRITTRVLLPILLCMVWVGCASTPKADWDSRVGNFSYDQAVLELGPPLVVTKLADGTTVAEWLAGRGAQSRVGFGVGTGFHTGGLGVGVGQAISPPPRDEYLRLTFENNGLLRTWKRVYR